MHEQLTAASEDWAYLRGRGYGAEALDLVAKHRTLQGPERRALERGVCSAAQYQRRMARELEAEDVRKRPLRIDAVDVLSTLEGALRGGSLVLGLDGLPRDLDDRSAYAPGDGTAAALDLLGKALGSLKPATAHFYVASGAAASRVGAAVEARAKALRVPTKVEMVADLRKALAGAAHVVSADGDVLDECGTWFNVTGPLVASLPGVNLLRLQG